MKRLSAMVTETLIDRRFGERYDFSTLLWMGLCHLLMAWSDFHDESGAAMTVSLLSILDPAHRVSVHSECRARSGSDEREQRAVLRAHWVKRPSG